MPGESGVTVVTTTGEHFYPFLPTRLRRIERPAFPAPSILRANVSGKTCAKTRGEIADSYLAVIASQRVARMRARWLAMTMLAV
jgi:hypothetical protein